MTEYEKQAFLAILGDHIRKFRIEKQLSLDELARKCGYISPNARSSMQKIEAGKCDISASRLPALALALGVSVGELMGYDEPAPPTTACDMYEKCHSDEAHRVIGLLLQLDMLDRGRVIGAMEEMLKNEKYATQKESSVGRAI